MVSRDAMVLAKARACKFWVEPPAQKGTIQFYGESSSSIKLRWKQSIGFVAQNPFFPNRSNAKDVAPRP